MCRPNAPKLLISVRDAAEASLALASGVDWIDLKEPEAGSLGQPSLRVAAEVAELLGNHPQCSVALGELCELDDSLALQFAQWYPFLKVGLSGLRSHAAASGISLQQRFLALSVQLRRHNGELIPVAYADCDLCGAPSVSEVIELARLVPASYLLIDTFVKDGRGLLDWMSLGELHSVSEELASFGCGLVLAGSLKLADAVPLLGVAPTVLAVRGAVCEQPKTVFKHNGPTTIRLVPLRTTAISLTKIKQWQGVLSQSSTIKTPTSIQR